MKMGKKKFYAEYSMWNDSAFGTFTIQPQNLITFTMPVAGSMFLSASELEDRDQDSGDEIEEELPMPSEFQMRCAGFDCYTKRSEKVVTRESLLQDPALFKIDSDSEESDNSPDRSNNSVVFYQPPRPRWRTPQQVHGRGRKVTRQPRQSRMEQFQSASMDNGNCVLHRMSWVGGALGCGIEFSQAVVPDPYHVRMLNTSYLNANVGFVLDEYSDADSTDSDSSMFAHMFERGQRSKTQRKQDFIVNVLKYICEFVRNDLQVEMCLEHKLEPRERRRIHNIVARLMGKEADIEFTTNEMKQLVSEIHRRNAYNLGTESRGENPARQMRIYKEARPGMFLVTPDDMRYPQPEEMEEETNPFLESIARHLKENDTGKEYTMLDRVLDFFIEFAAKDEYTVFRFLGAFTLPEVAVISIFFSMIICLIEKRPYLDYPEAFVQAFEKGLEYTTSGDANGFLFVTKSFKKTEEEKKAPVELFGVD